MFGSEGATDGPTEMAFVTKSPVDLLVSLSISQKCYEDHIQAWSNDDPRELNPSINTTRNTTNSRS